MKYYLCITPFFPDETHFQGPYILDQVKAIERVSDYKVIVCKPTSCWKRENDYVYEGINVYRFIDYSLPSNALPNSFTDWLTSMALIKKLESTGIDINEIAVAHAHVTHQGAYAILLKRKNQNIKTIVQHHGFDVMSITNGSFAKYSWHKSWCERYGVRICNSVDINVGVSNKTLDYVRQCKGVKLKKEYVLYNGVDTSLFYPIETSKNEVFTIGCVANFWPLKDQMTLIKAVELVVNKGIKNIKCIFVGSGETLFECQDYVATHGLSGICSFRKEMTHDKLPDFYRSLDLFVLPSYWEAFGCVYTEAYACGVPFIGVKEQGISEMISEENVDIWLINKGDYVQLSKLILDYMDSHHKQILSSEYNIDDLVSSFIKFINE